MRRRGTNGRHSAATTTGSAPTLPTRPGPRNSAPTAASSSSWPPLGKTRRTESLDGSAPSRTVVGMATDDHESFSARQMLDELGTPARELRELHARLDDAFIASVDPLISL